MKILLMILLMASCATTKPIKVEPEPSIPGPSTGTTVDGTNPPAPLPPIISNPGPMVPVPNPGLEPKDVPPTITAPGGTEVEIIGTVPSAEGDIVLETLPGQIEGAKAGRGATFSVKSTLRYMIDTAMVAECVIANRDFLAEIADHKQFDYTKMKSPAIAEQLKNQYRPAILTTYKKSFTKTIAYRNVGSNVVYFNTKMNPRSMKAMVNTAVHEWLHVQGFGHGDNKAAGKGNSVPYGVGKIAESYVDRCNQTGRK